MLPVSGAHGIFDENGTQGLFKAGLLAGTVEFQYMLDENHAVTK